MGFFWRKNKTPATAEEEAARARIAEARDQAAREKQAAKEHQKAVKRAHKLAKEEAKKARKLAARQQRLIARRTKALRKMQQEEEKTRVKTARRQQKADCRRRRRLARAEKKRVKEVERLRKRALVAQAAAAAGSSSPLAGSRATASAWGPPPLSPSAQVAARPEFQERERCRTCHVRFCRVPTRRRHHCRHCGESFCRRCLSAVKRAIPRMAYDKPQKVCFACDTRLADGYVEDDDDDYNAGDVAMAPRRVEAAPVPAEAPLQARRSLSGASSQQPVSESESTPSARAETVVHIRPRSKPRKWTSWMLPIRPLLKRKASGEHLRSAKWNLDAHLEKAEELARRRCSQKIVTTRQDGGPRLAVA